MQFSLLVFITVAEKKNFSRAAEALKMTQPAVSQQIHSLEEHYGAKLFERNNKRVELTHAGEILHQYATKMLFLYQESKQAVNDLLGLVTGKLVIGASLTIGEYVLPRLLSVYTHQFPNVDISVSIANTEIIAEHALSNDIDIGLVEGPVNDSRLDVTSFLEDEMVLIVPPFHPFANREFVDIADLGQETVIVREEGSGTRIALEGLFNTLRIHPKREMQFGSTQAIKTAVESGLGISFISKWAVDKEVKLNTLVALRIKGQPLLRQFSLLYKKDQFQSRALTEFAKLTITNNYD